MSVMTSVIPHGRPFTVADLEAMPDDGNRYELIDGMLIVTPAPGWHHQEMAATAYLVLRAGPTCRARTSSATSPIPRSGRFP